MTIAILLTELNVNCSSLGITWIYIEDGQTSQERTLSIKQPLSIDFTDFVQVDRLTWELHEYYAWPRDSLLDWIAVIILAIDSIDFVQVDCSTEESYEYEGRGIAE